MTSYDELTKEEVIKNIRNTAEEINNEENKEFSDAEKIFKLRYRQFIQGLYLQNVM